MSNIQKRNLLIVVVLALAVGAALFWLRRGGDDRPRADVDDDGVAAAKLAPTRVSGESQADEPPRPPEVAADADPVGTLRLEGLVLDEDEVPVAGATVTLGSNPPRTAESEEDGSFAFDELIGRTYWLSAHKDELVGGPVSRALSETSDPVVIHMKRGAFLDVEVVAAEGGAPIAGAQVKTSSREETTGADGRARFRGIAAGWQSVTATAEGYGPGRQALEIPSSPGVEVTVRIALRGGAPATGRVVTRDGQPVAGAKVTAQDAADAFSLGGFEPVDTGADGRFRIAALAAGSYRFVASHEEHPPASSELISLDGVTEATGIEIVVEPGAILAGQVVEAAGQPVPWASVRVQTRPAGMQGFGARIREATAGEDGRFEMKGLPRRAVTAAARGEHAASEPVEVDLGARGDVEDLLLRLDVTGVIAGVVVDGDDEPVADAHVLIYPDFWSGGDFSDYFLRGSSPQSTDGGGNFAFRGLPDGKYVLHASRTSAVEGNFWQRKGTHASTGETDLRVVIPDPGRIAGRVLGADGSAPELFTVSLGAFQAGVPVASKDGRFEIPSVAPGSYDIRVRGPGFTDAALRDVEVRAGDTTDLGTITVQAGRSLSGRVLDSGGRPIAGATVAAGKQIFGDGKNLVADFGAGMEEMFGLRRVETDERGSYRVTGIGGDKLVLAAEHPDHGRSQPVRIPPGADGATIDLVLQPFGSLGGKVTLDGEPASGAQVSATGRGNPDQGVMVTAGDDGTYRFERLPAGTYNLTVMIGMGIGSGDFGNAEATVTAGAEARADIAVEGGTITLAVTVRGEGGARIDAAQIYLFDGAVSVENGEQIQEAFLSAKGVKMTLAMGDQPATLDKVKAGPKSLCIVPLSGDLSDPTFWGRIQENAAELAVHCRSHRVNDAPDDQSATVTVPPMAPLSTPAP